MLNLGQVVYDTTNKRILIFGGVEMLQNQSTGKCHTIVNFLTEDLEELIYGKGIKRPFKYRNFDSIEGKVPTGKFINVAQLGGCFFGNVNFKQALQDEEVKTAVEETFKEAKTWPAPTQPGL